MPGRHLPGPRYRLKGDHGAEAMAWLATRDPLFQFGPQRRPNVSQIAYAARTTPRTLGKIIDGDLPLSAEVMAGLVKASGVNVHSERERKSAEARLFDYIDEDEDADEMAPRELQAAA
jgi:hypothetical protein